MARSDKISPGAFAAWCRACSRAPPTSQLWLLRTCEQQEGNLRAAWSASGLDQNRLKVRSEAKACALWMWLSLTRRCRLRCSVVAVLPGPANIGPRASPVAVARLPRHRRLQLAHPCLRRPLVQRAGFDFEDKEVGRAGGPQPHDLRRLPRGEELRRAKRRAERVCVVVAGRRHPMQTPPCVTSCKQPLLCGSLLRSPPLSLAASVQSIYPNPPCCNEPPPPRLAPLGASFARRSARWRPRGSMRT